MFGLPFRFAKGLQNSARNYSRKFTNLLSEEVDGCWVVQKGEGSWENLTSQSLESWGRLHQDSGNPDL